MPLLLLRLLVFVGLILLVWWAVRPWFDFHIIVDDRGVRVNGRIPQSFRGRLVEFLQEDVLRGNAKILGRWRSDGYLTLDFAGHVFEEDRQRIRNFLTTELRAQ